MTRLFHLMSEGRHLGPSCNATSWVQVNLLTAAEFQQRMSQEKKRNTAFCDGCLGNLASMDTDVIHIRKRRPLATHPDAMTLCGDRIHSPNVICASKSKIAEDDRNDKLAHVIHSMTEVRANKIEGLTVLSQRLLHIAGPSKIKAFGQCVWCQGCFNHASRVPKLPAVTVI